jgi:FkbM family methyltransferase
MLSITNKAISIGAAQAREEANPKIVARSSMEASVIRDLARSAHLTTYVDFGCWVGLLAQHALQDGDFARAVLVDAVPACLEKTAARINPRVSAECHNVGIVTGAEARPFQVPVNDTSCAGFGQPGVTIDVQQREVCAFLRSLNLDLAKTYLKVDLEGLDLAVASALSAARMLPRVLHIEFATDGDFQRLHSLLGSTYEFPALRPGHAFYSMALSQERAVLIGFDPDVAYLDR